MKTAREKRPGNAGSVSKASERIERIDTNHSSPANDSVALWVFCPDLHFPSVDQPTLRCLLHFLRENKVDGFVFGGDQHDNCEVSPHTASRPRLRFNAGSFRKNTLDFDSKVLRPIEALLPEGCKKIWLQGNHDDWSDQYELAHPELQGTLNRREYLCLDERGWKFVECGKHFKHGKLTFMHGEQLSGPNNGSPSALFAKRAVDLYSGNVLFGHFHSLQTFTKIQPHDVAAKWTATCSPILGSVNAWYLRNRPTNWLNGFTLIEFRRDGTFNCFPCVVTRGRFSYGGRSYGGKTK